MTSEKPPVTIKKYANRRLYNTGSSAYVTLEDLAGMVKRGDDFVVYDAKSGDDITRSVLAQIIFEQESKGGQNLLPVTFLRQLIRFYGDSMQMLVPSYLEFSLDKLTKEKAGFSDVFGQSAMAGAVLNNPMADAARPIFAQMEEQARQNVAMFRKALTMFTPGVAADAGAPSPSQPPASPSPASSSPASSSPVTPSQPGPVDELGDLRRQLEAMQRQREGMSRT